MSEILKPGPMDVIRDLNVQAREVDSIAEDIIDGDAETLENFQKEVHLWDGKNPLNGTDVLIYGDSLEINTEDDNEEFPLLIPDGSGVRPIVFGLYAGYDLRPAYDRETERHFFKVVHIVKGEPSMRFDRFGHQHVFTPHTYVCADGSDLIPQNPINAHSLRDLRDDLCARKFDELVFEENDPEITLRKIGEVANKFLISDDSMGLPDLNFQRISYLNSLGLLDGVEVVSREYVRAESSLDAEKYKLSSGFDVKNIKPSLFQSSFSYRRNAEHEDVEFLDFNELYIEGSLPDGESVAAPVMKLDAVVVP